MSDLFLSDVHVDRESFLNEDGTYVTLFEFSCQSNNLPIIIKENNVSTTDDISVNDTEVIPIVHNGSTHLLDVGLQVWRGSLYLSDYILSHPCLFTNKTCIELGAGVGLCSILLAKFSDNVICTDTGDDLLKLCQRNINNNSSIITQGCIPSVKKINWLKPFPEADQHEENSGQFQLTKDDYLTLENVTFVIAADVVYDDPLTDAFFTTFFKLLELVANENKFRYLRSVHFYKDSIDLTFPYQKGCKQSENPAILNPGRLNFTLDALEVACPAYDHFQSWLSTLCNEDNLFRRHLGNSIDWRFKVRLVPSENFQMFSIYDRVKELELWEIKADKKVS